MSCLARCNITAATLSEGGDKVKYFEDAPVLTSPMLVLVMAAAAWQGTLGNRLWFGVVDIAGFKLHPLVLLFALSGALMVSRIRIPKL